ncbi:hypothetical protein GF345_02850 [Candidatus Woesearchaeota archaeon]|nr:hypothetical protein [Candidatus Woesearchaeota archaeon]
MQYIEEAIKWITGILRKHDVPFQITGGLAAQAYGSERELYDIDIYIPSYGFERIMQDIEDYVVRPPGRTKNSEWNLINMDVEYAGVRLDICNADDASIFDRKSNMWLKQNIDFSESVAVRMFGIDLPMMPKNQLLEYKRTLNRDVDKIDIDEIISQKSE